MYGTNKRSHDFFRSVFSHTRTDYGDLQRKIPVFSTNTGKYRSERLRIWTLFTQCMYNALLAPSVKGLDISTLLYSLFLKVNFKEGGGKTVLTVLLTCNSEFQKSNQSF